MRALAAVSASLFAILAGGSLLTPVAAAAQQGEGGPGVAAAPEWLARWSPLRPVADLSRTLPGTPALPGLLTTPQPRTGLFWTAGNPAALPADAAEAWSGYRGEWSGSSGEFRRPLDPGTVDATRLAAEGWRPVGERGGVAGRVLTDRLEFGTPAVAELSRPFGSNPLVVLDTAGEALGRTMARIEGAGGLRLGPVGLGVSLGFEARETRTLESPTPRAMRTAVPAVSLGATWAIPGTDRLELGVHGRWERGTHWFNLFSVAGPNRIYEVTGYGEVPPRDVSQTFYRRETERESLAAGGGLLARVAGARIVLFAERGETEDAHWSQESNDPAQDVWTAEGLTLGAAAERTFLDGRLDLHGAVTRSALDGRSRLDAVEDQIAFTADEARLDLSIDARLQLAAWTVGARAAGTHDARVRADSIAGMIADTRSWTTAGALEVARPLVAGFSASLGAAVATYKVAGSIPAPVVIGDVYRDYIGPELALDATDALSQTYSLTLLWAPPTRSAGLFLTARAGSTTPSTSRRLPLAPSLTSDRTTWAVVVGASLPALGALVR